MFESGIRTILWHEPIFDQTAAPRSKRGGGCYIIPQWIDGGVNLAISDKEKEWATRVSRFLKAELKRVGA